MKIVLLGTGTPTPSLRRMGAGYLVQVGGDTIVFDLGPGTCHRMLEAGVEPPQVSHVFFSHLHYDHCVDYPRLLLTRWDHGSGKVPELRVYGPAPIKRMTEQLISREGAFAPDLISRTEHPASIDLYRSRGGIPPRAWPKPDVHELTSGAVVEDRKWRATVVSVPHFQPYLTCFAIRLDSPEGSFVYSGDAGASSSLAKLARNCDVLVHMCHMISGTALSENQANAGSGHLDAARIGQEAGAKNLVLSHFARQMDVPGVPERLIKEVSEVYKGNVFWGEDLMQIPVDSPKPARLD